MKFQKFLFIMFFISFNAFSIEKLDLLTGLTKGFCYDLNGNSYPYETFLNVNENGNNYLYECQKKVAKVYYWEIQEITPSKYTSEISSELGCKDSEGEIYNPGATIIDRYPITSGYTINTYKTDIFVCYKDKSKYYWKKL